MSMNLEFVAWMAAISISLVAIWTGFGFLFHFFDASHSNHLDVSAPAAPPKARTYVGAYVREVAFNFVIKITYLFGFLPIMNPGSYNAAGGPPIVLVPGYLMNRACLLMVWWRLRRRGYTNVYPVNLSPLLGSIEQIGAGLAPQLRAISQRTGGQPLHVIAHSMGGLVMRWAIAKNQDLPIAQLICLGTPHQGTRTAIFGMGDNCTQMRPGSAFLKELASVCRYPITGLYSSIDPIVMPAWSACHGERTVMFDHCGHSGLLFDIEVFDAILHALPRLHRVGNVTTTTMMDDQHGTIRPAQSAPGLHPSHHPHPALGSIAAQQIHSHGQTHPSSGSNPVRLN